jgi:hypothetical protein
MAIIKRLEKGAPLTHGELDNNFQELEDMIGQITSVEVINNLTSVDTDKALSALQGKTLKELVTAHENNTSNPHAVTKSQVGLSNVDNTSDANKPVSTATAAELANKAPINNPSFTGTVSGVTKAHVGLSNVDNTSDLDKPLSNAATTALGDKVDKDGTKVLSDTNYTQAEKDKLAGLESSHFKGLYNSVTALETAHPTASAGDYANVDLGTGNKVSRYAWDVDDSKWEAQSGESTEETAASIKTKYESNPDTNAFTDNDKAKVDGIEAGATADQTAAEIKTAYESNADTNNYSDADKAKVDGVEAGATADQTGAEIKAAYEAEPDTNVFTDAEKTKLAGIEAGATAGGGGGAITKDSIQEAMGYFLDPARDQWTWNTGNSQTFTFGTELIHEILISVNGQGLSNNQYTVAPDKLTFTINDTLQDGDIVKAIYLRKWTSVEPETVAYMESTNTPNDGTVVHNSLTGKQVWDYMDSLIKRAKSDGTWSAIESWHPMFGGTAAKHAYNVKDVTKYLMTFNGNWTIDGTGNKGGGTTADYAVYDASPTLGLSGNDGGWTLAVPAMVNATSFLNGATDSAGTTERHGFLTLSGNLQVDYNDSASFKSLGALTTPMLATAGFWNNGTTELAIGILNGVETYNAAQTNPQYEFSTLIPYYGARHRQSVGGADNPSTSKLGSIAYHTGDPSLMSLIHTLIKDWETFLGR